MGEKAHDLAQQSTASRREPPPRRQLFIAVAAWVVVGVATAIVTVNVVTHGPAAGPAKTTTHDTSGQIAADTTGTATAGAPARTAGNPATAPGNPATAAGNPATAAGSPATAAVIRAQAAGWMAGQLSPSAIVACDPQMCSALEGAGFQASRLLVLRLSAADPLGAEIVVATLAVRSQFGDRLASVYAPEVIASFGTGPAGIEIRYVAPDGASSFEASRTADRGARIVAGRQLLGNQRIHTSTAARTALSAGSVDPRLLTTLAALAAQPAAAQQPLSVAAFGDPSPGATDAPLRAAEIGSGPLPRMQAMRAFLLAQRPPYLPAQARITKAKGGQYVLSVQFDAPSPLGLNGGP